MLLLMPAMTAMAPGVSNWAKVIPSYYVVDTLHRAMNFGIGWSGLWSNLLIMTGFAIAFILLGILALRRKIRWA